jgi:hypothetical protein
MKNIPTIAMKTTAKSKALARGLFIEPLESLIKQESVEPTRILKDKQGIIPS